MPKCDKLLRERFPKLPLHAPSGGLGMMMLCRDDPLRDTPEKADRYAHLVGALSEAQRARARESDIAAALKVLASA